MTEPVQPLIEQPKNTKPKGPEAKIFTMPAKYRGTASAADVPRMAVPKPEKVMEQRKPLTPPPPPKPKAPLKPTKLKKPGFPVKLAIIGIIIIALFAAAAIVIWFSLNKIESAPEITRPITPPVVEEKPPVVEEEPPVVEEEEPPVVEEEPESPFVTELRGGVDSDSDGLTNIEETLYGTNPQLPDSDSDGFLDGNEVFHRYNPNGTAPGSLFESGLVMLFDDPAFSYTIFYPTVWNLRAVGGPTEQVVFTAATSEIVQILKNEKDATLSITEWFLTQDGDISANELLEFTTKEGLTGVMSPDRLTAYVDAGNLVYVVSYNVGTKATIDYLQTFQMMLNSLVIR
ncbi:MAG: hypothetical protein ABIG32_01465 [Candidatus Uhrbacteria bacterium]|nr:hypothetical protein [Patescibacteria group bacterium]MBU1907381.1 hypothetical protein [Patescibacteria group bacterium]